MRLLKFVFGHVGIGPAVSVVYDGDGALERDQASALIARRTAATSRTIATIRTNLHHPLGNVNRQGALSFKTHKASLASVGSAEKIAKGLTKLGPGRAWIGQTQFGNPIVGAFGPGSCDLRGASPGGGMHESG